MKRDRGRIVMNPPGVEFELLDDMQGETEEKTARPRGGEGLQAAGHAVIIERSLLRGGEAQSLRVDRIGPLGNTIERSWRENDVLDQDRKGLGMIQGSLAWGSETAADNARQGHPIEEMEEDRVWPDQVNA